MRRDVIVGKGAGFFLEVIDPQKEHFNFKKEVGEETIAFQMTLGKHWVNCPEGTLYVVQRAPEHVNRKVTSEDHFDAMMHYCSVRNLNRGLQTH